MPDITFETALFSNGGRAAFWLASTGHRADIGGIALRSMPPFSTCLSEEGCAIE